MGSLRLLRHVVTLSFLAALVLRWSVLPRALAAANAAASAARPPAAVEGGRQRLRPIRLTGRSDRQLQLAQQALPKQVIGTSSQRRSRGKPKKTARHGAGFTDLVKELTINPRVLIGEIAVVVLLSYLFEWAEHKATHQYSRRGRETGLEFLNALFKEFTVLGFVAFVIFLFIHTGTFDRLTPRFLVKGSIYSPGHNPLAATFETVHMMIFMLLVVFLAQAAFMFFVAEGITRIWSIFERTEAYGTDPESMESMFVRAGYMQRHLERGSTQLYRSFMRPFELDTRGAFYNRYSKEHLLHRLVLWRAVRHEFMFPARNEPWDGGRGQRVSDPSFFSFADYLRPTMGKVVLSLIHIDRATWTLTLVLLAVPLYICNIWTWVPSEVVNCACAWTLCLVGFAMAAILEQDTLLLTPPVPREVPAILQLFSGESMQKLRREKMPGWKDRPDLEHHPSPKGAPPPRLGLARALTSFLSNKGYSRFFRALSFFQAVSVTSLILSHLSAPVSGKLELIAYVLAWVEWPVMLMVIVPTLIRRLTFLSVIKKSKDDGLMAKVVMQGKESLLRDFVRLTQLVGFERRACMGGGLMVDGLQGRRSEIQMVLHGLKKYDHLSEDEQGEISLLFAAWDGRGSGIMETREMWEAFSTMGVTNPQAAVQNLIRLLDFDSTGRISWMKFKALFGLAVADVPKEDKYLDLSLAYEMLDTDHDGELTIFELSDGFERMHIGIGLDDMANLLFMHFGIAKPFITRAEFVQWMVAVSENQTAEEEH
mmetsp:Transcript_123856/g.246443  ORF Transcript_123856/g.246443 Transcript_123856/m.246443 type:complete len:765 (+) Transcript_123856:77-2371(+)